MTNRKTFILIPLLLIFVFLSINCSKKNYLNNVKLLIKEKKLDQAIVSLNTFIKKYPENDDAKVLLGISFYQKGKANDALKIFEKILQNNPNHFQTLYELAKIKLLKNNIVETEKIASKLLRLKATFLGNLLYCRINIQKKDFQEALNRIQISCKEKPKNTEARLILANVYFLINQKDNSLKELQSALKNDPRDTGTYIALSHFFAKTGKPLKAKETLEKLIEQFPKRAFPHQFMASYFLSKNNWQNAENEYLKAIELEPENTAIRVTYAFLCRQKGDIQKAKNQFEDLLKIAPSNVTALYQLADISVQNKKYLLAEQYIRKLLAADSKNLKALILKGKLLLLEEKITAAKDYLEKLKQKYPNQSMILFWLGHAYLKLGLKEKATAIFIEASKINAQQVLHNNPYKTSNVVPEQGPMDMILHPQAAQATVTPSQNTQRKNKLSTNLGYVGQ